MKRRTLSVLTLSAALLTIGLVPVTGSQVALPPDILIYDDYTDGESPAALAADNLALDYQFVDDACDFADALENEPSLVIVNGVFNGISHCKSDILLDLAEHASGPGKLIFQSWEITACGDGWAQCEDEHVDELLATLGVEGPTETYTSPPTLVSTPTVSACSIGPNPLLPAGLEEIEPEQDPAIIDAQGVTATTGIVCLESAQGDAQLVASENGAYMGFAPHHYEGSTDTTLPGPEDPIKIFENLITANLV